MNDHMRHAVTLLLISMAAAACSSRFLSELDVSPPSAPNTQTEDAIVLERWPWGTMTSTTPRFWIRGEPGSVEPEASVEVWQRDLLLGRVQADASGAFGTATRFALAEPDEEAVLVRAIDARGNVGPFAPVRDERWTVTIAAQELAVSWDHRADTARGVQDESLLEAWTSQERDQTRSTRLVQQALPTWRKRDVGPTPSGRVGAALSYDARRRRVVMFGGRAGGNFLTDETWEWDGRSWEETTANTGPVARRNAVMAYDPHQTRTYLYGGSSDNQDFSDTWTWDGHTWARLSNASPASGRPLMMAWDDRLRQLLLLVDEAPHVWTWTGTTWTSRVVDGDAPTAGALQRSSATWDDRRDVLVVVGGEWGEPGQFEVWELDDTRWSQAGLGSFGPEPREDAAVVYDPISETVLMLGGRARVNRNPTFDEVWAWDGDHWRLVDIESQRPSPRESASVVTWPGRGAVVFGGVLRNSPGSGTEWGSDLWVREGGAWIHASPTTIAPSARRSHASAYLPSQREVLLFGGYDSTASRLGDEWVWNGFNWRSVDLEPRPSPRSQMQMVTDASGDIYLLGGEAEDMLPEAGDLWRRTTDGWSLLEQDTVMPGPARGYGTAPHFDGGFLLFGGLQGFGFLDRTWHWTGQAWREPVLGTPPSSRLRFQMALDPLRRQILLQSGAFFPEYEAYVYEDTGWRMIPGHQPTGRNGFYSMLWEPGRERILMVGGTSTVTTDLGVWAWEEPRWSLIPVRNSPLQTANHTAVFDAAREEIIVFGGEGGRSDFLGETWLLDSPAWRQMGARFSHVWRGSGDLRSQIRRLTIATVAGGSGVSEGTSAPGAEMLVWSTKQAEFVPCAVNDAPDDAPAALSCTFEGVEAAQRVLPLDQQIDVLIRSNGGQATEPSVASVASGHISIDIRRAL